MFGDLLSAIRVVLGVLRFAFISIVFVSECVFWIVAIIVGGTLRLVDFVEGRRRLKDGKIYCDKNHPNETDNLPLECQKCGYRYVGSIWVCGSKECGARTIYSNCTTCNMSIRSPYRWGRP